MARRGALGQAPDTGQAPLPLLGILADRARAALAGPVPAGPQAGRCGRPRPVIGPRSRPPGLTWPPLAAPRGSIGSAARPDHNAGADNKRYVPRRPAHPLQILPGL